jgi:hypothetical protein
VGAEAINSILQAILEHTPEIAVEHPVGQEYCLQNAMGGITNPIHLGAKRYFSEQKIVDINLSQTKLGHNHLLLKHLLQTSELKCS